MTSENLALSVIMPCYNRGHLLARILRAYERQEDAPPFEVITVDDASDDDTPHILQQFLPVHFDFRYVRLPLNKGPAAARNLGLSLSHAPLVAFVGDDICPAADFIMAHVRAHHRNPQDEVAVLGKTAWPIDMPRNTLMTHIDGVGAQQFSYQYMHDGKFYDYRHLYTSNVSLKRAFLEHNDGRFDTTFPHAAFEDAELGWRLERHGLRIRYHADIRATHYHYSTIWNFTERQYRCGQMSWLFMRKHPRVFTRLTDRTHFRMVLRSYVQRRRIAEDADTLELLELRSLGAASAYEWRPAPRLDHYYYRLLQYFYYKGLLSAMFAGHPELARIRGQHATLALAPALTEFIAYVPVT
jgi:glycosyltransferase involved in cell wall biosynthesis